MNHLTTLVAVLAVAGCLTISQAVTVTLPEIYADHMVIQTDEPITLKGNVSPATTELEITLAGQTITVKPRLFGGWTATLDPISEPGGSHTLTISADGEVAHTIEDITFGDVWLCGGQSNMSWDMTTINNSSAEIAGANFPDIRLMEVELRTSAKPLDEVKQLAQEWTRCTPAAVRNFSAVGYLFGREIHQETERPIGLIQSAWGGSRIETWIPDTALELNPYADKIAGRSNPQQHHKPSISYNAMIHGLAPLALKGVIWYQGESNQTHPLEYRSFMESWIHSWRELWQAPELPFYYVQLANYAPGNRWELLREAQTQALAIPNTGMAVTIDIGASNDIHPRNKQGTATRLAALALANTYGKDRVFSGPQLRSATTDGHDLTLRFDHVGRGLASLDGENTLKGFEVLTTAGRWSKRLGRIEGDTVVIRGTLFRTNPQGVRYGWSSDPEVSLINQEGFPALPFRFEAFEGLSYDTWKDQLVGSARLPNDDANHDGVSNPLHYAMANKPLSIDKGSTIAFHRRATADDVSVSLERSTNLVDWSETWSSEQPESSGLPWTQERAWGTVMTDRYEVTVPAEAETAVYYRVRYRLANDE